MKPHMIFEVVLLALLAFVTLAAYACCVVAGRCSRIEEQRDNTAKTTPPIVGKGGEKDGRFNDIL